MLWKNLFLCPFCVKGGWGRVGFNFEKETTRRLKSLSLSAAGKSPVESRFFVLPHFLISPAFGPLRWTLSHDAASTGGQVSRCEPGRNDPGGHSALCGARVVHCSALVVPLQLSTDNLVNCCQFGDLELSHCCCKCFSCC